MPRPKKTQEEKEEGMPREISAPGLAILTGEPRATVSDICSQAGIETNGGKLPTREAVTAIVKHYRGKSAANATRDRKMTAEADNAELDLQIKIGTVVNLEDAKAMIRAASIEVREIIRKRKELTTKQKMEICELIAAIKPEIPK